MVAKGLTRFADRMSYFDAKLNFELVLVSDYDDEPGAIANIALFLNIKQKHK